MQLVGLTTTAVQFQIIEVYAYNKDISKAKQLMNNICLEFEEWLILVKDHYCHLKIDGG